MNRLFVLCVAVSAMAFFVLDTSTGTNAGNPFEEIKEQLYQTKEAMQAVPELVYAGLRSGSKHWVSPRYWARDTTTQPVANEMFEHTYTNTMVYILNSSRVNETMVKITAYDTEFSDYDDIVCVYERSVPPSAMIDVSMISVWSTCDRNSHYGWLEIVADREVFIDGEIFSRKSHMHWHQNPMMPSPAFTTRSGRTMTWYPVDSE